MAKVWIRKVNGEVRQVHYSTAQPDDSSPGVWSSVERDSKAVRDFEAAREAEVAAMTAAQQKRADVLEWLATLTPEQRARLVN